MRTRKTLLILAIFATFIFISAGTARADDDRQVWRDSEGAIVHDSWGTCVRSRWDINYDPCAEKIAWKAPEKRTIIAQADRTIYFAFDKSDLTPESQQRLNSLSEKLNEAQDIKGARVVGYADRIGTISYNQALSERRAKTVRDYMIEHGLLKPSVMETRWVGKSEPTVQCASNLARPQLLECLQPDRKVTVEVEYRMETQASDAQPQSMPAQDDGQPQ